MSNPASEARTPSQGAVDDKGLNAVARKTGLCCCMLFSHEWNFELDRLLRKFKVEDKQQFSKAIVAISACFPQRSQIELEQPDGS
jgi:hypothetical protein